MEKITQIKNNDNQLDFNNLITSSISNKNGKFYESKDNPNKIIRVEDFESLLNKHNNKIEILQLVETAKKLYKELEEKYNIIAPVDFIISKDNTGKDIICSITDKIEGRNLESVEKSKEFINEIEELYSSISRYFIDKFEEGGLYIWDINGESQYIYGKKTGDQKDKIYLIDTDIWLTKNKDDIYLSIYWLIKHMSVLENHFNIEIKEARNYINNFIKQQETQNFNEDTLKVTNEIKKLLLNKKLESDLESAIPRFE